MKTLVTYGSAHGGTAGIAERIATVLRSAGHDVDLRPAREVHDLASYEAVLVGGALYAMHWQPDARRFVTRYHVALRAREVYFFSSGPLDDSASERVIAPTHEVEQLTRYVGARAHVTFGGRLAPDVKGFPASAMAKKRAGDHRDWERIEGWAREIGAALAGPRLPRAPTIDLPSRAVPLGLALFVGVTAIAGGIELMVRSQGWAELPTALLAHSPFHDFTVPGALLFALVGVPAMLAAWRHVIRDPYAPMFSMLAGSALTIWMIVEMAMLRTALPLQLVYLAIGAVMLWDARQRLRPVLDEWKTVPREGKGASADVPSHPS